MAYLFESDRILIKRSIDDLLAFEKIDQVDKEPTKKVFEQAFQVDIGDHENLRSMLKYFIAESPFVKKVTSSWGQLFKMLTDFAQKDLE